MFYMFGRRSVRSTAVFTVPLDFTRNEKLKSLVTLRRTENRTGLQSSLQQYVKVKLKESRILALA